jgi:hypothetical protein
LTEEIDNTPVENDVSPVENDNLPVENAVLSKEINNSTKNNGFSKEFKALKQRKTSPIRKSTSFVKKIYRQISIKRQILKALIYLIHGRESRYGKSKNVSVAQA